MVEKLIRCTRCNQVIPQFDSFGDFGEVSIFPDVEWASDDLDEQKTFSHSHEGHPLEELRIDGDTFISEKPCLEPMKVSFVEATNGTRTFVIKRTRLSVDRPTSYELVPGIEHAADALLKRENPEVAKLSVVVPPGDEITKFGAEFDSGEWNRQAFDPSPPVYTHFTPHSWPKALAR